MTKTRVENEPNRPVNGRNKEIVPTQGLKRARELKKRLLHIKSESSNGAKTGQKRQTIDLLGT